MTHQNIFSWSPISLFLILYFSVYCKSTPLNFDIFVMGICVLKNGCLRQLHCTRYKFNVTCLKRLLTKIHNWTQLEILKSWLIITMTKMTMLDHSHNKRPWLTKTMIDDNSHKIAQLATLHIKQNINQHNTGVAPNKYLLCGAYYITLLKRHVAI